MTEEVQVHRRPAEALLVSEVRKKREELLDGFRSRQQVLRWLQSLTIRTLGQIPTRRYHQIATEFHTDDDYENGVLLSAFLVDDVRQRPLGSEAAERLRERWAADTIGATQVYAYRSIRKDAGEYVGDKSGSEHKSGDEPGYNPDQQSRFLMRPALEELDRDQRDALDRALTGLDEPSDILDWGDDLTKATRGEAIDTRRGGGKFIPKIFREGSTVTMLTSDDVQFVRAREAFLARWLLPAFNRGVQDLSNRTAEEPEGSGSKLGDTPSWGETA